MHCEIWKYKNELNLKIIGKDALTYNFNFPSLSTGRTFLDTIIEKNLKVCRKVQKKTVF